MYGGGGSVKVSMSYGELHGELHGQLQCQVSATESTVKCESRHTLTITTTRVI
jgi:hypothetical protein